ncbi:probable sucrose-phosphatase 1 [Lolium rigidum]|uniref:probable sucrose-phosphatase 1 n=1 Tax=Lolium rigidum TaxID=89674 RepID=UPI001F5CE117|nr:probable sucrose-phosphatase 1 [Lolium rigidum]
MAKIKEREWYFLKPSPGLDEYGNKFAVKKLNGLHGISDKKFEDELKIMRMLRHENIIRLVGYCHDKMHMALCLEHMPNGNLDELLRGGRDTYDWKTCYGIITGICQGLNYLHNGFEEPIYHLDLKPANVLLDEKMVPRIADFGISRLLRVGCDNYLKFTDMSPGESFDEFKELMWEYWMNRMLENTYSEQVKVCIEIGLSCVENDRNKRKAIKDIVGILKQTEIECADATKKELLWISKFAKLDRLNGPARLMVVSNLDYTMVDDEDEENLSLLRFGALWESAYSQDSLLVYSTGRSPARYKELKEQKPMLPTPDITIMSVGTEITYGEDMDPDDGWMEYLNNRWDRNIVLEEAKKFSQLWFQGDTEQRPHKLSFYVKEKYDLQEVERSLSMKLNERGVHVKMIFSAGRALDILAKRAGKGQALAYLLKKLGSFGKTPKDTLVCGDTGSDAELFSVPDVHGVMVNNAEEELVQWYAAKTEDNPKVKVMHATERCAAGIIQAIGYLKLGPNVPPRDFNFPCIKEDSFKPTAAVVKFYVLYEKWRRADVPKADSVKEYFKNVTDANGVIIQPSGLVLSIHSSIDALTSCYGDKQGKRYRSWVDRLGISQSASHSYLVWFDLWESEGNNAPVCCLTTLALNIKPETPEGFVVTRIHKTWLKGYSGDERPSQL